MTLLDRVAALLDERGAAHALIGAAALAAAGIARSTYDVDLLTLDAGILQPEYWGELRAEGIAVDVRRGDAADPLAGVVRLERGLDRPVDLIVGRHAWQARAIQRASRPQGGIPIVLPRDLVLLKLYAGGTQDLWDIRELLQGPDADRLAVEIEGDLNGLPASMRALWATLRS